jgi:hypothetical protein
MPECCARLSPPAALPLIIAVPPHTSLLRTFVEQCAAIAPLSAQPTLQTSPCGCSCSCSCSCWSGYLRSYEQAVMDEGKGGDKQSDVVRQLYHRQLQTPQPSAQQLLQEYEQWEQEHGQVGLGFSSGCACRACLDYRCGCCWQHPRGAGRNAHLARCHCSASGPAAVGLIGFDAHAISHPAAPSPFPI